MRPFILMTIATAALPACAGPQRVDPASGPAAPTEATASTPGTSAVASPTAPVASPTAPVASPTAAPALPPANDFALRNTDEAPVDKGARPSKIQSTATEAALKFIVIDKDKGPVKGIVISLTAPDGAKYYTEETDREGYAEVLVPVGQKYQVVYLSLGRREIAATVTVSNEKKQNIKLTLRYKREILPPSPVPDAPAVPRFVLHGVTFDTAKATIRPESFVRLDSVVEFMAHKKSARIEISGHTDNVGNPKSNKILSEKRAQACRDYLTSKGIAGGRIQAIGYGDERPIAANDTDEGRQKNRRIEATEL